MELFHFSDKSRWRDGGSGIVHEDVTTFIILSAIEPTLLAWYPVGVHSKVGGKPLEKKFMDVSFVWESRSVS